MSKNYDNWERLVTAVLRREWDRYIALCSSSDDPTNSSDDRSSFYQLTDHRVTVNGRLIPDTLVKQAADIAGPIEPGHYWYDFQGGFWGVYGGPCLGIIPPFIQELNFPMPENCAGGNTDVFVNGRELNIEDLNLLANRGLPTAKGRAYIVEISGRVLDQNSRKLLYNLGKLAPSVEKMKHGFGMRTTE